MAPIGNLIEVRTYTLAPTGMAAYIKLTKEKAAVRRELLPLLGMFTCELGGPLNVLTHLYGYEDLDQRDMVRAAAAKDPRWVQYIKDGRPHVVQQENKLMLQAQPIYEALSLPPTRLFKGANVHEPQAIYEMRQYQLHPGYGSVPKLVRAFTKGLPAKVASDPEGKLCFFGYTDVGALNQVMEVWRYPSAQACIRARQAARNVNAWRDAIAEVTPGVQHFTSSFMKPVEGVSPWL